jgi:hypothetical protein
VNFRDLIPPGEGAKMALKRELERRVQSGNWGPEYVYQGGSDLILRHGTFFTGREVPEQYQSPAFLPNQCFGNALAAAQQWPELRYFEGVYSTGASHFTPHAWCVDAEGLVVELTMPTRELERYHHPDSMGGRLSTPDHWVYAGLEFDPAFVEAYMDEYDLPMFDRPTADQKWAGELDVGQDGSRGEQEGFPILKMVYDPKRKDLP